jgi:acetyl-CoA synthetase
MSKDDPTPSLVETAEQFNIANAICRRHRDAVTRVALVDVKAGGRNTYTFGGLDFLSDKFANALSNCGVKKGDAVAVILPQSAALMIAHLGALKAGAAVLPLSFSAERNAVARALTESDASAAVAAFSIREEMAEIVRRIPSIKSLFLAGDHRDANEPCLEARSFWREINLSSSDFAQIETEATLPAFVFCADPMAGELKFAIRSHASVIEDLAASETLNNLDAPDESANLTATDWSSAGDLMGVIYPALWSGRSLVSESDHRVNFCRPPSGDIACE